MHRGELIVQQITVEADQGVIGREAGEVEDFSIQTNQLQGQLLDLGGGAGHDHCVETPPSSDLPASSHKILFRIVDQDGFGGQNLLCPV